MKKQISFEMFNIVKKIILIFRNQKYLLVAT